MTFKNTKRPVIYAFCGLPGSGKTTVAKELEKLTGAIRLNVDEWVAALGVDFWDDEFRHKLDRRLYSHGLTLLKHGQSIILEDNFWTRKERDECRKVARKLGMDIEMHYFDVPFNELWRRLQARNATHAHGTVPISKEVLRKCRSRFEQMDEEELALFTRAVVHRPKEGQSLEMKAQDAVELYQPSEDNGVPRLILFCGLPGSGKTTLAKKLEKEMPAVRLCPDEWMVSLGVDLFDETVRNNLEVQLWSFAQSLLRLGYSVILENGLWSHKERMDKLHDAAKLEVDVELHYLDVPLEKLLRRLEIRNVSGDPNTVPLTREHMEGYAKLFQAPDEAELAMFTRAFIYDSKGESVSAANRAVLSRIQALPKPRKRPFIIAISGFGGSGKTTLANQLKARLNGAQIVSIVSIDSFGTHEWHRNADWDNFDRNRFTNEVLKPARANRFPLKYVHEPWPGNPEETRVIPQTNYLIVEGCSIFHPDLLSYYDLKIWTDCPLDIATKRGMRRDRHVHKDEQDYYWQNIWMPNERDFLRKYHPDKAADITFNTN